MDRVQSLVAGVGELLIPAAIAIGIALRIDLGRSVKAGRQGAQDQSPRQRYATGRGGLMTG